MKKLATISDAADIYAVFQILSGQTGESSYLKNILQNSPIEID